MAPNFKNCTQHTGSEFRQVVALELHLRKLDREELLDLGQVAEGVEYNTWKYQNCLSPKDGIYVLIGGPHPRVARTVILTRTGLTPREVHSALRQFILDCQDAVEAQLIV